MIGHFHGAPIGQSNVCIPFCLFVFVCFHPKIPHCSGEITKLYDELCEMEIKQNSVNPELKSAYKDITQKIKNACTRHANQMAICKTHFKKAPSAKSRSAKAKAKCATVPKSEEKDDDDQ